MQAGDEFGHAGSNVFQTIVEQAPDAMIFADRAGVIRLWNAAAETLFGHAAAAVLGASLDVIIPPALRRAHWDGFNRAIASGQAKLGGRALVTRSLHKDGSKLYVEPSFGLVRGATGAVVGALALGRDCTARHLAHSALRSRLAVLEQTATAASNEQP